MPANSRIWKNCCWEEMRCLRKHKQSLSGSIEEQLIELQRQEVQI